MKKQILILIGLVAVVIGFFLLTNPSNSQQGTLFQVENEFVVETDVYLAAADGLEVTVVEEEKENADVNDGQFGTTVFVDVQGEVNAPGVFEVAQDVRVGYLIALAGGLTDYANVRGLNQAARIYDEMVIFVAHVDDEVLINEQTERATNSSTTSGSADNNLISLSTASATELQSLPGIGPSLSANIIAHRTANGAFSSVDELINVTGIGTGIVENIREFVRP